MKMKKILKEWRKFVIKEGLTLQDQQLGAPDNWFSEWNEALGNIDYHPMWREKLENEYSSFIDSLMEMINDPNTEKEDRKEYQKIVGTINSGFAYYSTDPDMMGLAPPFDEIVKIKLDIYFQSSNISQENKDFFAGNYERIMDYGLETMIGICLVTALWKLEELWMNTFLTWTGLIRQTHRQMKSNQSPKRPAENYKTRLIF